MKSRHTGILRVGSTLLLILGCIALLYSQREWLFQLTDAAPIDAEYDTHWYCHDCSRGFSLAPRQYEPQLRRALDNEPPEPDGPYRAAKTRTVIICPTCGQNAVTARRCPRDGVLFDPRPSDASRGVCPRCGWDPNR